MESGADNFSRAGHIHSHQDIIGEPEVKRKRGTLRLEGVELSKSEEITGET